MQTQGDYFFLSQEHVLFGAGSLNQLADETRRIGGKQALIITGQSLATRTDVIDKVTQALGSLHVGTFTGIRQHTPRSGVTQAAEVARSRGADVLVSVGGGSPIDATKAVALELFHQRGLFLLHIAIPTTLSAAEFSHLVGVTDEERRMKAGFADTRVAPRSVILDSTLTLSTPLQLWLSSGIRALDHAVETLYAPSTNPISDVLALEAIRLLFEYLPRSREQPGDLEVRTQLQIGAWMSFFGEVNTPMGLSHNIGRRIGATYNVPHGITSCITLPHVMRALAPQHARELGRIAQTLHLGDARSDDQKSAFAAADAVSDLVGRLGLPRRLSEVGITESELHTIAVATVAPLPQLGTVDHIESLLKQML